MDKVRYTLVLLLFCGAANAANTGEKSPASAANEGSPTTAWQNLTDVFSSNDNWTTYAGTTADSLYVTNFSMGVTAGATIDTIFVTTEAQGNATQDNLDADNSVRLTGGTTPLWNTTWTAAEVNASTFGVVIWKTAAQAGTILIDHVTIYIAYTEAGGETATARRRIVLSN